MSEGDAMSYRDNVIIIISLQFLYACISLLLATTSDAATDVSSVATEIRSAATFSKLLLIMSHTP